MIFFGLLLGCFLVAYMMPGRRHRAVRDSARAGFGRDVVLRAPKVISVIVPLVLLLSGCSKPDDAVSQDGGGANEVTLVAKDSSFEPDVLELPAGVKVTVKVINEDGLPHDFAIASIGLETETIEPNRSDSVTFVTPDSPTEFVCTFHPDMKGRIDPVKSR
jgi:plastocyanin